MGCKYVGAAANSLTDASAASFPSHARRMPVPGFVRSSPGHPPVMMRGEWLLLFGMSQDFFNRPLIIIHSHYCMYYIHILVSRRRNALRSRSSLRQSFFWNWFPVPSPLPYISIIYLLFTYLLYHIHQTYPTHTPHIRAGVTKDSPSTTRCGGDAATRRTFTTQKPARNVQKKHARATAGACCYQSSSLVCPLCFPKNSSIICILTFHNS